MAIGSMYTCIGEFKDLSQFGISGSSIIDFVSSASESKLKKIDKDCKLLHMKVALKGKLGEQAPLKSILLFDPDIDTSGFGSVAIKISLHGINYSLTVFNPSGKFKLCGGIPASVSNDPLLAHHVSSFMCKMEKWLLLDFENLHFVNLVGKISFGKNLNMFDTIDKCKEFFNLIKEPQFEKKGRRNAWKLYKSIRGGKQQITIGSEGNGQIFGCRSFIELNYLSAAIKCNWSF